MGLQPEQASAHDLADDMTLTDFDDDPYRLLAGDSSGSVVGADTPKAPVNASGTDAGHPGVWRVLSFLVVVVTALISGLWILQSRSASDVAVQNSRTLDVAESDVVIADLTVPNGSRVAVLGVDRRLAAEIASNSAQLSVPSKVPSVVAMLNDRSEILGLALVSRDGERDPVSITPETTAHTILALAPSILEADIERARQRVDAIKDEPAVIDLIAAVRASPNLSQPNDQLELALGAILDRIPLLAPPDQGCDSILNSRAVVVVGACAEPVGNSVRIHNEQERWAIAFHGPEPFTTTCGAIAPAGTPGSLSTLTEDDCGTETLIAAPGPIRNRSEDRSWATERVHEAASVDLYASYLAPLLDLTGGAAGLNRPSNSHVLASFPEIIAVTNQLSTEDSGFTAALDVTLEAASNFERHTAVLGASRSMLAHTGALIDGWDPTANGHLTLLDLYDRAGEQMFSETPQRRWTADAWGVIAIGNDP